MYVRMCMYMHKYIYIHISMNILIFECITLESRDLICFVQCCISKTQNSV